MRKLVDRGQVERAAGGCAAALAALVEAHYEQIYRLAWRLIGTREDGSEVRARRDGFIVFPNPAATPGNEWFYFAQRSERTSALRIPLWRLIILLATVAFFGAFTLWAARDAVRFLAGG